MQIDSYTKGRLRTSVLVVGGGLGGVAAALAVTALGVDAILTEESDWIGGQATSQGVPPDEHFWIEHHGRTRSYNEFRRRVRDYYHRNYPLRDGGNGLFDPGLGSVSRIAHEPRIAHAVMEEMLAPRVSSGRLRILRECEPVSAEVSVGRIRSVAFRDARTGKTFEVQAQFVLDATECGDLLKLAAVPYVTGSEGRDAYGELHDLSAASRPENMQAITWAAALGFDPACPATSDQYRIAKPRSYEQWASYCPQLTPPWPGPLFSWRYSRPRTLHPIEGHLFRAPGQPGISLWRYRRILAEQNFCDTPPWHEASILNWPQNDYFKRSVIDVPAEKRALAYSEARDLTLSLIYWLQNDAPRPDGGEGYAGLYLRGDVMGTSDGLAKAPYLREVRRVKALRIVTELDIGIAAREGRRPEPCIDSVGTGYYRIDLHPTIGGDNYVDVSSFPFQIPFASLVAPGFANFLAAAKNIGTSHIANGCYRLHPVEWNIGEAAGCAAVLCLKGEVSPEGVANEPARIADLQRMLHDLGVGLEWPEEVFQEHSAIHADENEHPTEPGLLALAIKSTTTSLTTA